ncbi:hypothetical protein GCM10020360_13440 [Nonlabens tegetincola]
MGKSPKRKIRLERQNTIPKRGDLLVNRKAKARVDNPASVEAHQPFEKCWCGSRRARLVEKCRRGSLVSSDVFPSGYGVGILSPAVKIPSIRVHNVSDSFRHAGEP